MTHEEILQEFGRDVVGRAAIRDHPFKDPATLVDVGSTGNGGRIHVNRESLRG